MTTIFVFGSSRRPPWQGRGALRLPASRRNYGQGIGLQGGSYAIPTKDARFKTLPLAQISTHVEDFKIFAASRPALIFQVTSIGCGLASYTPAQIAPMFRDAPANCLLPDCFTAQ